MMKSMIKVLKQLDEDLFKPSRNLLLDNLKNILNFKNNMSIAERILSLFCWLILAPFASLLCIILIIVGLATVVVCAFFASLKRWLDKIF